MQVQKINFTGYINDTIKKSKSKLKEESAKSEPNAQFIDFYSQRLAQYKEMEKERINLRVSDRTVNVIADSLHENFCKYDGCTYKAKNEKETGFYLGKAINIIKDMKEKGIDIIA